MGKALNLGTTHPFPERRTEGNTREERAGCRLAHPLLEAGDGGGERGKVSPRDSTPYQTVNRLPASNQRLPEILVGRHPPGGSQLESSSPEQKQGAPDRDSQKLRRDYGGENMCCTRGECSWLPELLRQGRHKTQPQPNLSRCGVLEHLNLSRLSLRSAHNPGPDPWRAAWSLSSVDGESTHHEQGQTQCGQKTVNVPHTHQ